MKSGQLLSIGRCVKIVNPEEFKQDALKLADKIGVQNTANKLNIPLSNLHGWKSQKNIPIEKSQDVLKLQAEVKRLKKQLAEEKAVVEMLKKATAFFSNLGYRSPLEFEKMMTLNNKILLTGVHF